jgi:molybdopterin converting factor small subunit
MVAVTVELLGPSRLLAREPVVHVDVPEPPTLHALVVQLAAQCPALVGPVLDPDRQMLVEGHIFNVSGRQFPRGLDHLLRTGDRILVLASAAGG